MKRSTVDFTKNSQDFSDLLTPPLPAFNSTELTSFKLNPSDLLPIPSSPAKSVASTVDADNENANVAPGTRPMRRSRPSINYALPNLRQKMRREDTPGSNAHGSDAPPPSKRPRAKRDRSDRDSVSSNVSSVGTSRAGSVEPEMWNGSGDVGSGRDRNDDRSADVDVDKDRGAAQRGYNQRENHPEASFDSYVGSRAHDRQHDAGPEALSNAAQSFAATASAISDRRHRRRSDIFSSSVVSSSRGEQNDNQPRLSSTRRVSFGGELNDERGRGRNLFADRSGGSQDNRSGDSDGNGNGGGGGGGGDRRRSMMT